jgi:hypothetical protein
MANEDISEYFVIETGSEFPQPLMQKLEGNKSAILCWRTEEGAKLFLSGMDSHSSVGFRVIKVDGSYLVKIRDGFKERGIEVMAKIS